MLSKINMELYQKYADYVRIVEVRDAFHTLVGAASSVSNLNCYPEQKGEIQDFRYYSADKKQPFSFIINRNSLLFYLRPPAIESNKYSFSKIRNHFTEVNMNTRGEWTIRICNRRDALIITEMIVSKW
jgi:hypothetical protein